MSALHRLNASQLRLNEALPWDVYDVSGQLLLRKGYVVQRTQQIEMLLERGMFVDAVEFKAYQGMTNGADASTTRRVYDPLSVWQGIQAQLHTLMTTLPSDGSFEREIQNLARHVIQLCNTYPDLAIAAILLKEYKRYPIAHSVHCAVLCALIARRGDLDEDSQISLCCAALTQNIAMIELQQQLVNQKDPLSVAQQEIIQNHPILGVKLLLDCGVMDDEWLRAVAEHHETAEGTGYPIKTTEPSMLANMLHTCDVFAAMLSPRAYRKPIVSAEAAKQVYLQLGHGKDCPFPGLLIKEIGMYPPGTLVKLANGEVGVVSKRGEQAGTPIVATLINAKGLPQIDHVLRDTASVPALKVVSVMPRESAMVAINFEKIWTVRRI